MKEKDFIPNKELNQHLLGTPVVKSSIQRYINEGLKLQEIIERIEDIHLIFITKEELKEFLKKSLQINMDNEQ